MEVEKKNREIEQARSHSKRRPNSSRSTSKYKSEFLANMSHELRTPLNSLLILSKLLAQNTDSNLSDKQVEFARTIHSSGSDLLELINEILDLSRIEVGDDGRRREAGAVRRAAGLRGAGVQGGRDQQGAGLPGVAGGQACPATIETDPKRLQQVLKNLLSNALKFTERGSVRLDVALAKEGWSPDHRTLNDAPAVVAFRVTDTGIGIIPRSTGSSSSRSSRPTGPPAASTAAPASACRSAARSRGCSAARSGSPATSASAARSRCICRASYVPVEQPALRPSYQRTDAAVRRRGRTHGSSHRRVAAGRERRRGRSRVDHRRGPGRAA